MFGNRGKGVTEPVTLEVEFVWYDPPATEDDIRRIVREEMAEIVLVDVPDTLPEDLR